MLSQKKNTYKIYLKKRRESQNYTKTINYSIWKIQSGLKMSTLEVNEIELSRIFFYDFFDISHSAFTFDYNDLIVFFLLYM